MKGVSPTVKLKTVKIPAKGTKKIAKVPKETDTSEVSKENLDQTGQVNHIHTTFWDIFFDEEEMKFKKGYYNVPCSKSCCFESCQLR